MDERGSRLGSAPGPTVVRRLSDFEGSHDVASVKIEANRPIGQTLGDTEHCGLPYRGLLKRHRPSMDRDVASA